MTSPLTAEALESNPETRLIAEALGVSVSDYVATVLSFSDPGREATLEVDETDDVATSRAVEAAVAELERELEAPTSRDGFEPARVTLVQF